MDYNNNEPYKGQYQPAPGQPAAAYPPVQPMHGYDGGAGSAPQYGAMPVSAPPSQPAAAYAAGPSAGGVDKTALLGSPAPPAPGSAPGGYRDMVWMVVFWLHVLVITGLAGWGGKQIYDEVETLEKEHSSNSGTGTGGDPQPATVDVDPKKILYTLLFSAFSAALLSGLWILFLIRFAKSFIVCTVLMKVVMCVAMGIALYALTGFIVFLIVWGLFAALALAWYFCVRNRLAFAGANVEVGAGAVGKYPATLGVAGAMLLASFVWVALWSTAAVGVAVALLKKDINTDTSESRLLMDLGTGSGTTDDNQVVPDDNPAHDDNPAQDDDPEKGIRNFSNQEAEFGLLSFVLLISFYWGVQVWKGVLHTTVAGTVGTWWRQASPQSPTYGAFCRAMGSSFGTVAFGSFLIAVIQAMKAMTNSARRRSRGGARVALACMSCFLNCIQRLAQYFTSYVFVYAALYGTTFYESASRVMNLFKERGFSTIINDVIIDRALSLGLLLVGLTNAGVGVAFGYGMHTESGELRTTYMVVGGLLGFLFGLGLCSIVTSVIHSAVQTVYVCWAEAPEALAGAHPEAFGKLLSAWMERYPEIMREAGYDRFQSQGAVPVAAPVGTPGTGYA